MFCVFLNNVSSEALPQCFRDPTLLFLRGESWLVREENTSLLRNKLQQQLPNSIFQPSE